MPHRKELSSAMTPDTIPTRYKVYFSNGCQIISPYDSEIAKSILENLEPLSWDEGVVDAKNSLVEHVLTPLKAAYFRAVEKAISSWKHDPALRFVYTPMHGVGLPYMTEAVSRMGILSGMIVVQQQASPDPDFPTVRFPNPEEPGALDLALATADEHGIKTVIANDPDADRLAVAEKVGSEWHQLTGNQVGVLLASHVLDTYRPDKSRSKVAMLSSTVSTSMLQAMAQAEGFHFEETLTGFKWLGNKALDLASKGYDTPYAFEEAIGYMISSVVHDKDAIAAGSVFLSAMARWKTQGWTPWTKLQQLYETYGYFETANTYFIAPDPSITKDVFDNIRQLGDPFPPRLARRRISRWRDLTTGYDSSTPDHVPALPVSRDSQMITCELAEDLADNSSGPTVRFTIRGSGTEPKIKLYIECQAKTSVEAQKGAREVLHDLTTMWFRPEETGLQRSL
ncbi:MAG: Phosphoglucomutase-3 [Thelocarpon superellum]|nr:MAG: Phosphoglucomutase-3 [Thelocarpon superellum]